MSKTALQELIEWTNSLYKLGYQSLTVPQIEAKATQLLAKEKEQHRETFNDAKKINKGGPYWYDTEANKDFETYFNQTYKQK